MDLRDLFQKPGEKKEEFLLIALSLIAIPIIGFGIYELFSTDLLRVESDVNSHAIRGYFFVKNPGFVDEWYLGADIFKYYPPVPLWLSAIMFAIIPEPGLSLSVTFLLLFLAVFGLGGAISKQLKGTFSQGAFASLMLLASYPSISRYVNGGRFGDLAGLAFLLAWAACGLLYYKKPSKRNLAFLFAASLLTMLTHFISGLMLIACAGTVFLYSLWKKDSRAQNTSLVTIAGAAPSILFWVPFYLQANKWVAGSGVFTSNTHYDLRHWLFFLLMLFNFALLIKWRPWFAYFIALLLLFAGAYKLDSYSVVFKEDFLGLEMDGRYTVMDGFAGPAIFSVLAYKGYKGDYGSYDPGAPENVVADYFSYNRSDCASLDAYSEKTGVRYFITNQTNLDRCGYRLIWSSAGNIYDYSPDFNKKVPLLAAANASVFSAKLNVYERVRAGA